MIVFSCTSSRATPPPATTHTVFRWKCRECSPTLSWDLSTVSKSGPTVHCCIPSRLSFCRRRVALQCRRGVMYLYRSCLSVHSPAICPEWTACCAWRRTMQPSSLDDTSSECRQTTVRRSITVVIQHSAFASLYNEWTRAELLLAGVVVVIKPITRKY